MLGSRLGRAFRMSVAWLPRSCRGPSYPSSYIVDPAIRRLFHSRLPFGEPDVPVTDLDRPTLTPPQVGSSQPHHTSGDIRFDGRAPWACTSSLLKTPSPCGALAVSSIQMTSVKGQ